MTKRAKPQANSAIKRRREAQLAVSRVLPRPSPRPPTSDLRPPTPIPAFLRFPLNSAPLLLHGFLPKTGVFAMPSETRRLSVAMIARDAEPTIAASLDSVRANRRRNHRGRHRLARSHAADRAGRATKVVDVPWTDDFSAARNACLANAPANGSCGSMPANGSRAKRPTEIRRFIDEAADPAKVYLLIVQLPPSGEHGMSEQVGRIRLMPNSPHDPL